MLLFEVSLLRNVFEKHWIFSISAHPHIWRSRMKLLTLQGINVSWYFYRQAYTRLLLVSQTVLRHFSDGHFAVTSQTSLHLGKKTVFLCKRKMRFKRGPLWISHGNIFDLNWIRQMCVQ